VRRGKKKGKERKGKMAPSRELRVAGIDEAKSMTLPRGGSRRRVALGPLVHTYLSTAVAGRVGGGEKKKKMPPAAVRVIHATTVDTLAITISPFTEMPTVRASS